MARYMKTRPALGLAGFRALPRLTLAKCEVFLMAYNFLAPAIAAHPVTWTPLSRSCETAAVKIVPLVATSSITIAGIGLRT